MALIKVHGSESPDYYVLSHLFDHVPMSLGAAEVRREIERLVRVWAPKTARSYLVSDECYVDPATGKRTPTTAPDMGRTREVVFHVRYYTTLKLNAGTIHEIKLTRLYREHPVHFMPEGVTVQLWGHNNKLTGPAFYCDVCRDIVKRADFENDTAWYRAVADFEHYHPAGDMYHRGVFYNGGEIPSL